MADDAFAGRRGRFVSVVPPLELGASVRSRDLRRPRRMEVIDQVRCGGSFMAGIRHCYDVGCSVCLIEISRTGLLLTLELSGRLERKRCGQ